MTPNCHRRFPIANPHHQLTKQKTQRRPLSHHRFDPLYVWPPISRIAKPCCHIHTNEFTVPLEHESIMSDDFVSMPHPNMTQSPQRQIQSLPRTQMVAANPLLQSGSSRFETTIANSHTILESLIAQLPTESVLRLYQTSSFLRSFLRNSPTSWRYMSWRLHQPAQIPPPVNANAANQPRQSSSYALDQLLMYVILPFSTRLTSLVLDNTSVSGATLFQTVMILRKDTLEHVSVRGCKNVSLKYHINPWLTMHAMALEQPPEIRPPELQKLALKSLYTYRCRHHRRRPYLPSSLAKKESDSEPTHEVVLTCHKLGIWTDTAWCTTPGARCYRRRGYVTMRVQQDPREVWVVYDRLWRSRNWLGPPPSNNNTNNPYGSHKRKRDGRVWEEEEAFNGEPTGLGPHGKEVPVHLRESHTRFVEDVHCDSCSEKILERCEQCSILMHCSGCRKTLCASCAFDRPYLRNQNATEEEKRRFWWAPGCAVSPCSMQDVDPAAAGAPNQSQTLPSIKFMWCCTQPVFSGGGGITLGTTPNHDADKLRAAPLAPGQGFEDPEFAPHEDDEVQEMGSPLSRATNSGPGGRWASLAEMFRYGAQMTLNEEPDSVPRILCNDCYISDQWKIKCKACSVALCLKHDVKEKQRVRICGYKELPVEKQELVARLKATKLFRSLWLKRKEQQNTKKRKKSDAEDVMAETELALASTVLHDLDQGRALLAEPGHSIPTLTALDRPMVSMRNATTTTLPIRLSEPSNAASNTSGTDSEILRPLSPGSNSTGPLSRSSSPAPSAHSLNTTPEPRSKGKQKANSPSPSVSKIPASTWRGCQAFFCSSTRPAGDHRRRCAALLRQCTDCRVHVCDDCTSAIDKSCPCRGCRLPLGKADALTGSTAAFYCPNCRHDRIINRKCKRNLSYLTRTSRPSPSSRSTKMRNRLSPAERLTHIPDILLTSSIPNSLEGDFTLEEFFNSIDYDEFQELREMSLSAVNVVKRVQSLRNHAAPGSPAALALPVITIEEADINGSAEPSSPSIHISNTV